MQDVPSYAVAVSSHVLRSASDGLRVSQIKITCFLVVVHKCWCGSPNVQS